MIKSILFLASRYWKQIAIIVLLLVVFFSIKGCNESNQKVKELEAASKYNDSLYSSSINDWKDKNGALHQTVDNLYVGYFSLVDELDSVNKLLNIKTKQVVSFSKTSTELQVDLKPKVDTFIKKIPCGESGDSISIVEKWDFDWLSKNKATHVWGTIGNNEDSVHVFAIDTLSRSDYWKRKWFLGAKTYYTDFHNSNENIKVVGYKGVLFRQKEKKFSVGLAILYGYPINNIQLNRPAIAAGVSLQYSLFKF